MTKFVSVEEKFFIKDGQIGLWRYSAGYVYQITKCTFYILIKWNVKIHFEYSLYVMFPYYYYYIDLCQVFFYW